MALQFIPYRRVFRVRTITVRDSVNIGRSPFNKNSGFGNYHLRAQWNGTFRLHRPDPSNRTFGHCSCKQDAKERYWGQQFCQMERTFQRFSDRNERIGQSEQNLEVVPNVLVRPSRDCPVHLISNRNFRNLGLNGKRP